MQAGARWVLLVTVVGLTSGCLTITQDFLHDADTPAQSDDFGPIEKAYRNADGELWICTSGKLDRAKRAGNYTIRVPLSDYARARQREATLPRIVIAKGWPDEKTVAAKKLLPVPVVRDLWVGYRWNDAQRAPFAVQEGAADTLYGFGVEFVYVSKAPLWEDRHEIYLVLSPHHGNPAALKVLFLPLTLAADAAIDSGLIYFGQGWSGSIKGR